MFFGFCDKDKTYINIKDVVYFRKGSFSIIIGIKSGKELALDYDDSDYRNGDYYRLTCKYGYSEDK